MKFFSLFLTASQFCISIACADCQLEIKVSLPSDDIVNFSSGDCEEVQLPTKYAGLNFL